MKLFVLIALCATLKAETYVIGLLHTPAQRPVLTKEAAAELQKAHMQHIGNMAASGALVGAGPIFETSGTLRGLFIFGKTSLDKARELAQADPKVKAGDLEVKFIEWDGPAGIGERYRQEHQDPSAKTRMLRLRLGFLRSGKVPAGAIAQGRLKGSEFSAMFVMNAASADAAHSSFPAADVEWHGWMVADGVLP